jgi:hypothetical protein
MATSRDFVYDEQGEMLPSDSAAAAARRKELDDDARMVSDAKDAAKAPVKAPVAAKAKPAVVTKEELAKSGLSLRDYMNKQRGLTRRDGKTPSGKTSAPSAKGSMIQSMDTDMMRTASRTAAKEAGEKRKASTPVKASTTAEKPKALAISSGVLKQREADEKRREERREFGRQRDAKKKEESAAKDQMSPGQRSAARGKAVKEFFGMAKGGSVSSASKRADGIAQRGKTRGKVY